jgi:hypothetical protein
VGTQLLAFAEKKVEQAGYDRVWLTCSRFNLRASSFYAARGYAEVRRYTERSPSGIDEEFSVLERRLSQHAERALHFKS